MMIRDRHDLLPALIDESQRARRTRGVSRTPGAGAAADCVREAQWKLGAAIRRLSAVVEERAS